MQNQLISSQAATTIFSLAWAKQFLRVEHDHEDDVITSLLASAVAKCEAYGRVAITRKTYDASYQIPRFTSFSCLLRPDMDDPEGIYAKADLPVGPVESVESVTALAVDESLIDLTVTPSSYRLDNRRLNWMPGFWQTLRPYDYIVVRYITGHTNMAALTAMRPDIAEAVGLALVSGYNRETDVSSLPHAAARIMESYWMPA